MVSAIGKFAFQEWINNFPVNKKLALDHPLQVFVLSLKASKRYCKTYKIMVSYKKSEIVCGPSVRHAVHRLQMKSRGAEDEGNISDRRA